MESPERNQIGTPVSKFEDSPVFNYINSLSPIKPVKSVNIAQTFNSLTFASLPSVFTSPHVNLHKETRFLRRHQYLASSKPEFSSETDDKSASGGATDDVHELSTEQSNAANQLLLSLKYDCDSSQENESEIGDMSASLVPYVQADPEKGTCEGDMDVGGTSQIEQNKETTGCDWDKLISDSMDLLVYDSPNEAKTLEGPFGNSMDQGTSFCTSLMSPSGNDDIDDAKNSEIAQNEVEDPSTQPNDQGQDDIASGPSEKMDEKHVSNLHRGMRRRCLVFEITGARKKNLDSSSNCTSSLSQTDNDISQNKQLVPIKPGNDSARCILPGIGLHLNGLATASKDFKLVKRETLASSGSFLSPKTGQEILNKTLTITCLERVTVPAESAAMVTEVGTDDLNQSSSPKKKRRRLEHGGENDSCKRCNCKKSKCLKLYCECFAAGVYCVEPCSCQGCFNKPIHEDTVLATRKNIESRNPLAFAPKVIRGTDSVPELGDDSRKTPASARHKRGCNCKKSSCLKKYCECYQGSVGCSINCRCEGCKNAFGRKDGSANLETEAEQAEEETDSSEKIVVDRKLQKAAGPSNEESLDFSALPATPLLLCSSQSLQLPFSSKGKPPRSSILTIGSSSGLLTSHTIGKSSFVGPNFKFEKHFQSNGETEMPEILRANHSPISGIKTSPNSKRVSPPHHEFGQSPGRRSGRKLILQSIPSFPSLTSQP